MTAAFVPRVEKLFDRINSLLANATDAGHVDMGFLQKLRQDALKNRREWQTRLDPYIHCLKDQGHITGEELSELLALASECPEPVPRAWEFFSPLGWIFIGSISVVGWMTLAVSGQQLIWFTAVVALMGGAWGAHRLRRPASQPSSRRNEFHLQIFIAFGILAGIAAAYNIPLAVKEFMQYLAEERHKQNVADFEAAPEGMPYLKKIAKENFGVEVFLGDPKYSFQSTTMHLPGSSSASMNLAQGYCEMNFDTTSVLRDFGPKSNSDRVTWLQLVAMHELAHCVDVARDLPAIGSNGVIHKFSLAPTDQAAVKDIPTYVAASRKQTTILWREAYADIMAIGFVKLKDPSRAAALAGELRNKRAGNSMDTTHATTCWIDHAVPAAAPASMKDLASWSETLRSTAKCKT